MKQKNVAGIFLIPKNIYIYSPSKVCHESNFRVWTSTKRKIRKNLSGNEIGCSVNSEKCF